MAELKKKASDIKKNVVTQADEERLIKDHYEHEDELLEKSLGKRYLSKIEPHYRN